ncbi:MAG: methyltransferase domain-containing protein [Planctomycetota bacterium]
MSTSATAPGSNGRDACRLCGNAALTPILTLDPAPPNISRLLRADELAADQPVRLIVYQCDACGFVQLPHALAAGFYDDYLMTVSHSPQMRAYHRDQATEFVRRFRLAGRRVVEVGCGDGHYLACLRDAGADVCGLEPSARFRALVAEQGLPCLPGYVTRSTPAPGSPYAAFAARQVLEHVLDIRDFLLGLRASLEPGGAGLVEVPSLEQSLAHGRFYDFFPDHLNYFSARTLRLALSQAGFEVEHVTRGMHGEYNVAWVRVGRTEDLTILQACEAELRTSLQGFVRACQAAGGRVAAWGAGGKGLTALAAANVRGLAYVVDADPHKHGLYTPVSHFPVVPPERLRADPVDTVIVTALAYRDEILVQLRALGFRGRVVLLGRRLEEVGGFAEPGRPASGGQSS